MSGIAGIIRFDGGPVEPGYIEAMTGAMAHRGPDGIRHWSRGPVAVGHCMLRTTPESLQETQPLTNEDESLVLVMDGRVDNWQELRSELLARGAKLRTRADAELVLRAYETWGTDCVLYIDGDFGMVIWDQSKRQAFCARDRTANKPFVFHWDGKQLLFASDVQAILAIPTVPQVLNKGMLAEFLGIEWYSRDETFWQGVKRLVAAHTMCVTANGTVHRRYWEPDYWAPMPCESDQDLIAYYRSLLDDQVRRMTRSHCPVAFDVSGGLDSSALFALAHEQLLSGTLPAPEIRGYALAFPDDADANEIEFVRAVGQHLQRPIVENTPEETPFSWYQNRARTEREFPGYPNSAMAIGIRREAQAAGSRVTICGKGGDEWLGLLSPGSYYAEELAAMNLRNIYHCLRYDARAAGLGQALWWFGRLGLAPLLPEKIKTRLRRLEGHVPADPNWLSPELGALLDERRNAFMTMKLPKFKRSRQLNQFQVLNYAYNELAHEMEDRMCSRIGLEFRSPFNSRAIIEFAFATPERIRSRGGIMKWLHRHAMRGTLPDLVVDRVSKADFMGTFRRELKGLDRSAVSAAVARRPDWVNSQRLVEAFDKMQMSRIGEAEWVLWSLLGCDCLATASDCTP